MWGTNIQTAQLTKFVFVSLQIEGSFVQGMGFYTTEELYYSPEGVLHSRGPDEYKIPTITDVPAEFNVSLLPSSQTPLTIYSSKVNTATPDPRNGAENLVNGR